MSDEIEQSLVETIRSSELDDMTFEIADAMLSPIPVFSTLAKLYGGIQSLQTHFYVKKVLKFLKELESIPKEERQAQLDKFIADPDEQFTFGEHLALLLDRMNDVHKATLMGRIARAFLEGKISRNDLESLNFALDAIDMRMTDKLKKFSEAWDGITNPEGMMLAQCGLMNPHLNIETTPLELAAANLDGGHSRAERYQTFKSASLSYKVNSLGKLFIEICLAD